MRAAAGSHRPIGQAMGRLRWLDASRPAFVDGNRVTLLRNGGEFFPALIEDLRAARSTIFLETYIYYDDEVGRAVAQALAQAARRGVRTHLVVDGFGTPRLDPATRHLLIEAGVQLRVFRPERWWNLSMARLRRMHRKLAAIDGRVAYVGGINILDDYIDPNYGPLAQPRFDFAVRAEGPIVAAIEHAARRQWAVMHLGASDVRRMWDDFHDRPVVPPPLADGIPAAFVKRDNVRSRRSIERAYLAAIGHARREVFICNAYFVPGVRFRRALAAATRRGVRVVLLLQGRKEYRLQHYATHALYDDLLNAGIEIYEYKESFLHAKVAVIDDTWCTVGSSNLDPFSLLLAREANLIVRHARFAAELKAALVRATEEASVKVGLQDFRRRSWVVRTVHAVAYRLLRALVALTGRTTRY